jgi:predicted DCC family thiol-disulfide oxidoreductase YuxK
VALTRVPGIAHLLDAAYRAFAKNRSRLTGRCTDGACAVERV